MAYNVKFLKGTQAGYEALAAKDANTFYFTGDNLYLGAIKLSNAEEITAAVARITQNEADIDNLEAAVGTLASLKTSAKDNLVAAINEVLGKVDDAEEAGKVTINTDSTTSGMLKSYTVKQGDTTVGTIDIPKDMVVKSGEVVVDPEGQTKGTYIVLTLANATEDKVYVNVGSLVDIYTAAQSAAQVQLAINSTTREISATIVAGSIGTTELVDAAIVTAKIADNNVTKVKLSADVQASLDKADSSVQKVATGTTNGTIAVDGKDVAVKGLGSAAYTEASAYDEAGAAEAVRGTSADTKDKATVYGAKAYADSLGDNYDAKGTAVAEIAKLDATVSQAAGTDGLALSVTEVDGKLTAVSGSIAKNTYDAYGAAEAAETTAKKYTDDEIAKLDATISQTAGTDGLAVSIVETDGKLTSVTASIKAETYDTFGAADVAEANAKAYIDTALTWGTF